MAGIFINYRTGDESYAPGLIDQRLRMEFGDAYVFRDTRTLRAGTEFPPELRRLLKLSTVLLALIGSRWLTVSDESGARLIDNPKDWVRLEIRKALKRNVHVIPVLLGGANLPTAEQLPDDIRDLNTRQYIELRMRNPDPDLQYLVDELIRLVPTTRLPASRRSGSDPVDRAGQQIDARHTEVWISGDGHQIKSVTGGDSYGG